MNVLVINVLVFYGTVQSLQHKGILDLYRNKYTGDGTYYRPGDGGACSYHPPRFPPVAIKMDKMIALNAPQFYGSLTCGMCIRVNGSGTDPIKGVFTAFVKDLCRKCQAGDVNLAETGDGKWKVEIQAIQCPVGDTKIEYKFHGSNQRYIRLQIRNARIPVTAVELYQRRSRRWSSLVHTKDGFWIIGKDPRVERPIEFPIAIRLTAANGQRIIDGVSRLANDVVLRGIGKQFEFDPSLP